MTWKLVDAGNRGAGKVRTTFAIHKSPAGFSGLIVPHGATEFDRANMYVDGSRISFEFCADGQRKIAASARTSKYRKMHIPSRLFPSLDFGTTDCVVTRDGNLLVIDLAQFDALPLAAE